MHSTHNAVTNHEYRSVPITALAESATNPRKRFDAQSLEELAASFKTQGILAPLLVRELEESRYEVVAGAPMRPPHQLPVIRLYDLRHTSATLALAAGVPPKVVAVQLGHASAAFTLDIYSHVLPHMQAGAASRVEALLFPQS